MKTKKYTFSRSIIEARLFEIRKHLDTAVEALATLGDCLVDHEEVYTGQPNELDVWPTIDNGDYDQDNLDGDDYRVESTSFKDPYFRHDRRY